LTVSGISKSKVENGNHQQEDQVCQCESDKGDALPYPFKYQTNKFEEFFHLVSITR
jgi:hypothetical protein